MFSGAKNLKVCNRTYGVFLQAQTPTCTKENRRNCYGYMLREGYFNGQVLLWAEPSPIFFRGKKIKMAPTGTFCFVTLNLRNPQWRSGKLLRIYISHMVLTNACPPFGGPSPILTGGKKNIFGNIFDKGHNWRFTGPQRGGIPKIKKVLCTD